MVAVIDHVLPYLGDTKHTLRRQGAAEVCHVLTKELELEIVPFLIILGALHCPCRHSTLAPVAFVWHKFSPLSRCV